MPATTGKIYLGSSLVAGGSGGGDPHPLEFLNTSGAAVIDPLQGVYTQSGVYSSNQAATAQGMTAETPSTTQTATDTGANNFIQIDYGEISLIKRIFYRAPNNTLAGGWGSVGQYTWKSVFEISNNAVDWLVVGGVVDNNNAFGPAGPIFGAIGPLQAGIWSSILMVEGGVAARFVRIRLPSNNWLALQGFYASSDPP
jgi:hypothetical protein